MVFISVSAGMDFQLLIDDDHFNSTLLILLLNIVRYFLLDVSIPKGKPFHIYSNKPPCTANEQNISVGLYFCAGCIDNLPTEQ